MSPVAEETTSTAEGDRSTVEEATPLHSRQIGLQVVPPSSTGSLQGKCDLPGVCEGDAIPGEGWILAVTIVCEEERGVAE